MSNLRLTLGCVVFGVFAGWRIEAQQPLYYGASSATLSLNTLDRVATNGSGNTVLFTATGVDFNKVNRCTSMAVDGLSGKLFCLDGTVNAVWSVNLDGSGLALVKAGLTNYPTDLALDVLKQQIYFTTSSTIQGNNTVQRMDYTGSNNGTLFTASGPVANGGNGVSRCTAIAVDLLNSKIFLADAGAQKIWRMNLDGTGLLALATTASNSFPSGVALDVSNALVYFTVSSTAQSSNLIQRVNYNGTGLTTLFTASGSVQRCTALDLDAPHATIYLSDAGPTSPALWRVPLGGGSATTVLSGMPATAKKVRFFNGPTTRPPPGLTGIEISRGYPVLNATNGFAGGTYYVLMSTNVNAPLNQWQPILTNVLGSSGNFTVTLNNSLVSQSPRQFYILRVQ
jgi:hypothetical protein